MGLDIGVFGARGVPSTYSGYETFLTTLLPELVERGHKVTIYCRSGEGFEATDWQGVHRKVLPAIAGKSTSTLSHSFVAAAAARRAGHDVVLTVNVANAFATAFNRWTGQPVVMNVDGQEWLRGKWGTVAKSIFKTAARVTRYTTTAPVVDCEAMAAVYRSEFSMETTVLPYCPPSIDYEPSGMTVRNHDLEARRYFVTGGRLNPENNIDRIANAYAKTDFDYPLVILGAANYDSPVAVNLRELAARDDRIRILGHIGDRSEFFDLLRGSACYLHGHSVGGMNPSLVEAMWIESRILAFDTAFNRDTLGPKGQYFDFDGDSLTAALEQVLMDSEIDDELQRVEASLRIGDRFSVKAVCDGYQDVLVAAAAGSARRNLAIETPWAGAEPVEDADTSRKRSEWQSQAPVGASTQPPSRS